MATTVAADAFRLAGTLTPATPLSTSSSSPGSSLSSSAFVPIFPTDSLDEAPAACYHSRHLFNLSEFDWEEIPPASGYPTDDGIPDYAEDEIPDYADYGGYAFADPDMEWEEILVPLGSLSSARDGDGITFDPEEAGANEVYNGNSSDLVEVETGEAFEYAFDHEESYEVLDVNNDDFGKIRPPAAKWVVDKLSSVVLMEAGDCAVCKERVDSGEMVRKLPCEHWYHEGCIFPWLGLRNSCPLCRFELPTDDSEYESWKERRLARIVEA